jgi:hypothetical protein
MRRLGLLAHRRILGFHDLEVAILAALDGERRYGLRRLGRAMLRHPLQSAGMYLQAVDALFGTRLLQRARRVKQRLDRRAPEAALLGLASPVAPS